jgi:hypothetical protein
MRLKKENRVVDFSDYPFEFFKGAISVFNCAR